jgi:hypothetical protein
MTDHAILITCALAFISGALSGYIVGLCRGEDFGRDSQWCDDWLQDQRARLAKHDRDGRVEDCGICLADEINGRGRPSKLHSDGFHYHGGARCKRRAWRGDPPRKCQCKDCRANASLHRPADAGTVESVVRAGSK